jgi:hypothetical protein
MSHASGLQVQGDNVRLGFKGTASATAGPAIVIYDSNNNVRTLAANERLVIDTLSLDTVGEGRTLITNVAVAYASATSAQILADFDDTTNSTAGPTVINYQNTGLDVPLAVTPFITNQAGSSVTLVGTGRIITGGTQGKTPSWQAAGTGRPNS